MKKGKDLTFWIIIAVLFVGLIGWAVYSQNAPSPLDGFAQCLSEKGAQFYGAFWCPHCQNQKAMFGSAQKYLPYTECSTPDGQRQLPICTEKGVKSYPTWRFADGSELVGEISLKQLSEKTSCPLPSN